jgi:hypothetical protein
VAWIFRHRRKRQKHTSALIVVFATAGIARSLEANKQHGCFSGFLDITRSGFQKNTQKERKERLLLLF